MRADYRTTLGARLDQLSIKRRQLKRKAKAAGGRAGGMIDGQSKAHRRQVSKRRRHRHLDAPLGHHVFMLPGYSHVRRLGFGGGSGGGMTKSAYVRIVDGSVGCRR